MIYYSTFFTHSGAIKFSRKCTKLNIENESGPVPRKLSSNCGVGVKFSYDGDYSELYTEDIEKIYRIENNEYILLEDYDG